MKEVEVVPHDPNWSAMFEQESVKIREALGENIVTVHHIGSTSIPGIYAKPIIDMLAEVKDIVFVDERSAEMELLGYQVKGEFGIPGRRYFRKDNSEGLRTHHIHVFEAGSEQAARHLAFRDYMLAHPDEAQKYSELKRMLAHENAYNAEAYMDGKDGFIKDTDNKAAVWTRSKL